MSDNATPEQIVARLVALGPTIPGVLTAFADVSDTAIPANALPALGVIVGRVLDITGLSLTSYRLTQEYVLFLHVAHLSERKPLVSEQQQADALAFLLPLIAFFEACPRLQLEDSGIVFRAILSPDGIPRRTVRDKVHYLGMAARLRVTTHHSR